MSRVLVAEDSRTQSHLMRMVLDRAGFDVMVVENGLEALRVMDSFLPDLVVTDLNMPELDGCGLIRAMWMRPYWVPVVLTTSGDDARETLDAMRLGASYFLSKQDFSRIAPESFQRLLNLSKAVLGSVPIPAGIRRADLEFELENHRGMIAPIVGHLVQYLRNVHETHPAMRIQVAVALQEALINAMVHGNWEIGNDVELKEANREEYQKILTERQNSPIHRQRHVKIDLQLAPDAVVFTVIDEGPGFLPHQAHLMTAGAIETFALNVRGLAMIRAIMDEVTFRQNGKQIIMKKIMQNADSPA